MVKVSNAVKISDALKEALEALIKSEPRVGFNCTCMASEHWPNCNWKKHQDAIKKLEEILLLLK